MSYLSCQAKKHDEEEKEEHVEVAEGQELEVIPRMKKKNNRIYY